MSIIQTLKSHYANDEFKKRGCFRPSKMNKGGLSWSRWRLMQYHEQQKKKEKLCSTSKVEKGDTSTNRLDSSLPSSSTDPTLESEALQCK